MGQREIPPTLAQSMYPHLAKQKEDAKAADEVKARSRRLAADLREARLKMQKARLEGKG
jgi:hypothetical protein